MRGDTWGRRCGGGEGRAAEAPGPEAYFLGCRARALL